MDEDATTLLMAGLYSYIHIRNLAVYDLCMLLGCAHT